MNPVVSPEPPELSPAQVRALLDAGDAVPLLPDHLPVPIRIGTRWWHVPLTSAEPATRNAERDGARDAARYVAAPPDQAIAYDRLAARLAEAAAATPRRELPPP